MLVKPLAQPIERGIAAKIGMHAVLLDGKARATHVPRLEVGKNTMIFLEPFGMGERNLAPSRSGLPNSQEPHKVKPSLLEEIEFRVANVIQRGWPPELGGKFR